MNTTKVGEQSLCDYKLRQGLLAMNILLDEAQVTLLLRYLTELDKWNRAYNLSAIRDPQAMVSLHLLDSLALYPGLRRFIKARPQPPRLLDVGTGAGLPGLPLAIACPALPVTLLDSNGKKTRFLFQAAVKLGLNNVIIENNRVEKFSPATKFAIVTSRAFASLGDMVTCCAHLLEEGGQFWAMKGLYPRRELAACSGAELLRADALQVAGVDAERHLIVLTPK